MKKILLLIIIFFLFKSLESQSNFQFYGNRDVKQKVSFKLINNLIVIPLNINGIELSFILDTGVGRTILFNLSKKDSLDLNKIKKVNLKGLGSGESVEALLSEGNRFRIKNLMSTDKDLYVILRDNFNFSAKMGVTIHGIIGYDLLKDVIVKIDYNNKVLTFYNPQKYKVKKCRKCEEFNLQFYRNKPYIKTKIQIDTVSTKLTEAKLLIDSGGSDALWLFEGTKKEIKTPKKFFKDVLGEGLSGTIYGNRSKIPKFKLGDYVVKEPTVSFLDTTTTVNARQFEGRNGSIGGGLLRRFKIWVDYPNNRILFKKGTSLKKGFYYNMSGLIVVYDGQELVKEKVGTNIKGAYGIESFSTNDNNAISFISKYSYRFKSSFKIEEVIEGSPAYKAGLEKNDIIKEINGKPSHSYTLDEINGLFMFKPKKRITIKIEREGFVYNYKFKLEKRI